MLRPYFFLSQILIYLNSTNLSLHMRNTRGFLYTLARLLGDISAVKKGRVGKRFGRRVVGRKAGRGIGKLFR